MGLVRMTEIMEKARKRGAGVGAFSIYNLASLRACMQAAEALDRPLILMIAEKRFPAAPFEYVGPMLLNAAKNSPIDIAVHLDHGKHLPAHIRLDAECVVPQFHHHHGTVGTLQAQAGCGRRALVRENQDELHGPVPELTHGQAE